MNCFFTTEHRSLLSIPLEKAAVCDGKRRRTCLHRHSPIQLGRQRKSLITKGRVLYLHLLVTLLYYMQYNGIITTTMYIFGSLIPRVLVLDKYNNLVIVSMRLEFSAPQYTHVYVYVIFDWDSNSQSHI